MPETKKTSQRRDREVAALYEEKDLGKKSRGASRARKKRKNAPASLFKRPIVCPPDGAGRSRGARAVGYVMRLFVIAMAVFGFAFFLADAFRFHYSALDSYRGQPVLVEATATGRILLTALLATAVLGLLCIFQKARLPALLTAGVAAVVTGVLAVVLPQLGRDIAAIPATLVNEILERLHSVNYLTSVTLLPVSTDMTEETLVKGAAALLTVLIALVFVPFTARRVRILPPAIFASVILVFVFVCNIMQSNWAFVFLLASFAALLVMYAYDRLYTTKPEADRFDTTAVLFPAADRPELPEEYVTASAHKARVRAERKRARAEKRAVQKERRKEKRHTTVDEEISDYFSAPKQKKRVREKKPRLTPTEKKAARLTKKNERAEQRKHRAEIRRKVEAVRAYDRVTEDSRAAAGGYAGVAVFLLMLVLLFIPALTVRGKFKTIPAIDEKMEYYREYLTALLVGDEDILDALDYEKDAVNVTPHSATLTDRYYSGAEMFYVRSSSTHNHYMTGWIGTDFSNDAWHAVSDEQLEAYRKVFSLDETPAEDLKYDFYRYTMPDVLQDPCAENIALEGLLDYGTSHGVVLKKINVRRLSDKLGSTLYLPSSYVSGVGVLTYEGEDPLDKNFVNYFDGILAGRDFREELAYSSVAYVTTMQNDVFMRSLSREIAEYNMNRALYELYQAGMLTSVDVNPNTTARRENGNRVLSTEVAELAVTVEIYYDDNGAMHDVRIRAWQNWADGISFDLFTDYLLTMTRAEKKALAESYENYDAYKDHAYGTYLDTATRTLEDGTRADSKVLAALSDLLASEVGFEPVGKDGNAIYSGAYADQHEFVMHVVEYMRENLTYVARDEETLDIVIDHGALETDESLDTIENFLTVTKQGYCVQFASALCLLLREQGIPARYVEGYVADGQTRDLTVTGFTYHTTVRDYNFHAWVEVWYDGIGWMQYEATPGEYYYDMYPRPESDLDTPVDPAPVDPKPPETPDDELPEDEEDDAASGDEEDEGWISEALLRVLRIAGIVLLTVGAITAVVTVIAVSAANAERRRDERIRTIRTERSANEEERRQNALWLIDETTELLRLYGLSPETGELLSEYAARLTETMPSVLGKVAAVEGVDAAPPPIYAYEMDMHAILLSVAAEEFGGGMTEMNMRELAEFFSRLRTQKKRFVPAARRWLLHYFRHKL